jgi:hypothetical protein
MLQQMLLLRLETAVALVQLLPLLQQWLLCYTATPLLSLLLRLCQPPLLFLSPPSSKHATAFGRDHGLAKLLHFQGAVKH